MVGIGATALEVAARLAEQEARMGLTMEKIKRAAAALEAATAARREAAEAKTIDGEAVVIEVRDPETETKRLAAPKDPHAPPA